MTLGEKIKSLRLKKRMTRGELAEKIGISVIQLYRIETDKSGTTFKQLKKIANILDVDLSELISDNNLKLVAIDIKTVPVVGYVGAGEPLEVDEVNPIKEVHVPEDWIKSKERVYGLIVRGNSMKGAGVEEGDILLVSPDLEVYTGDLVVAVIDDKVAFKRVKVLKEGILLESYYPDKDVPPIFYTKVFDYGIKIYKVFKIIREVR